MWIHPKIHALKGSEGKKFMEMLRVASTIPTTDCWRWPGPVTKDGYGIILLDLQPFTIHTVSFQLYKGHIPKGFVVMHECDLRRCWKPGHLFLGTPADNVQDMIRKGRASFQRKPIEKAREERCREVERFQMPYGYPELTKRFRCVLEIGHDREHWYDLLSGDKKRRIV